MYSCTKCGSNIPSSGHGIVYKWRKTTTLELGSESVCWVKSNLSAPKVIPGLKDQLDKGLA